MNYLTHFLVGYAIPYVLRDLIGLIFFLLERVYG